MVRCFTLGYVLVLLALAASMVLLPLMLPPLPPPPLVLLFFPVGIMAALMLLAFSPSDANRSAAVAYSPEAEIGGGLWSPAAFWSCWRGDLIGGFFWNWWFLFSFFFFYFKKCLYKDCQIRKRRLQDSFCLVHERYYVRIRLFLFLKFFFLVFNWILWLMMMENVRLTYWRKCWRN